MCRVQGKNVSEVAAGLDGLDQSTAIWQNGGTVHEKYSFLVRFFSYVWFIEVAHITNICKEVQ
jgi:hypothetical protein